VNAVALTFAELHYLLPDGATSLIRLQLREDADGTLAACGLASLVARGLLETTGDSPSPRDELAPFLDALTCTIAWIEIGLVRANGVGAVQIYESSEHRVNVVAQPFGTFVLTEAERGVLLPEAVGELIRTYLSEEVPGGVFLKAERADTAGTSSEMALRSLELGLVEVSYGGSGSDDAAELETVDVTEVGAAVERLLSKGL
jgi:hypothetical protein